MSLQMIIVGLIGRAFALAANMFAFTIIGQINQQVPERARRFFLLGYRD